MTKEEFETLVAREFVNAVPIKFRSKISNVGFLVEDEPSALVRESEGLLPDETLLGLYHGIPLTHRGEAYGVGATVPDTITLYKLPIEAEARSTGESTEQIVRDTIWHEVAHHFGLNEDQVSLREELRKKI